MTDPNDQFGYSVSVDGDIAIIGAYLDDDDGDASGAAYIFTHDDTAWPQAAKLVANDAAPGDYFGTCVSVSGDSAIVGALFDDDGGIDSGSAYLFSPAGDCNVNAIPDTCEPDHDNDGIINDCDNCPTLRNPSQTDLDADGVGDLCDNCPEVANLDQLDSNNDSIGDVCPCPMRGDMNDDGIVDSNDIQLFVEKLLS
ncbi:MAG TPA: thrombospondin type 3 repeat-containing protein [Phycisphaerae bacterium]|nr:thrombospondin type 3 repeat-containing protein [Phycisphaerae bacterium]